MVQPAPNVGTAIVLPMRAHRRRLLSMQASRVRGRRGRLALRGLPGPRIGSVTEYIRVRCPYCRLLVVEVSRGADVRAKCRKCHAVFERRADEKAEAT
jgi:hypothetical protein